MYVDKLITNLSIAPTNTEWASRQMVQKEICTHMNVYGIFSLLAEKKTNKRREKMFLALMPEKIPFYDT